MRANYSERAPGPFGKMTVLKVCTMDVALYTKILRIIRDLNTFIARINTEYSGNINYYDTYIILTHYL